MNPKLTLNTLMLRENQCRTINHSDLVLIPAIESCFPIKRLLGNLVKCLESLWLKLRPGLSQSPFRYGAYLKFRAAEALKKIIELALYRLA